MTDSEPPSGQPPGDDTALLIAALNHSWAWFDGRANRASQLLNYYLVSTAVLLTAYTSAINGKHYGLAAALAVVGLGLTTGAYAVGIHELTAAGLAELALIKLQAQLARRLHIDEIQMAKAPNTRQQTRAFIASALGLATLLNISALLYALIH